MKTMQLIPCSLLILLSAVGAEASLSATNLPPTSITPNRAPLLSTPFVALPLGSVRPQGWLLTQCELQRDGLTGNAELIYEDLGTNSAWLGGTGESWERGPYYFKGLIALAYTLNDDGLKQTAQKWMDWLLENQQEDGFIGPSSNNDWWPRMVATYALKDYYEATGDSRVLTVLSNYFDYMRLNLPAQPLQDWGKARAGDEMDVALWLYNRNGDTNLLTLAELLREQAYDWPDIMAGNDFMAYGTDFHPKHNVNVAQALKMPMICYQLSKEAGDRDAMSTGIAHLMREHGLSCGINSGTEFLAGNASVQGVELCSIVEAMLSLETAGRISGDTDQLDQLEKISFNALPAALTTDMKGLQYYTMPNNVISIYGTHGYNQNYADATLPGPHSGYPCCCYNFHMGWPKYVQNAWAATGDGGLAVMAYGPTVVNALIDGTQIQITEETGYPFEDQIQLQLSLSDAATFPLKLRIPGWAANATVQVNGQVQPDVEAGTFLTISRIWSDGDVVELTFPMSVQTESGPSRSVAINRGPLVYSLQIGEEWTTRTPDPLDMGFNEYEITPTSSWNYALQLDPANPDSSFSFSASDVSGNPFDPSQNPITLTANARPLTDWTIGWRGVQAFEPPVSPVLSTNAPTSVTLVPFGSQHLRVSWFPYLGTTAPTAASFSENFDTSWSERWTVFGGNWMTQSNALSTVPGSAGGAKALAMATDFTNINYEADVSVGAVGNAGVIFRASKPDIGADAYCGYYVGISAEADQLVLGYSSNAWNTIATAPISINADQRYHLKVQAVGSRMRIFVDDSEQPTIDIIDARASSGMIGVRNYCTDGDQSYSSFAHVIVNELSPTSTLDQPVALMHRWSFNNNDGTDSIGGADATLVGTASFAGGQLQIPGGSARADCASVDIADTLAESRDLTIEGWFTMNTLQNWSKLWMFGTPNGGAQPGLSYVDFTPRRGDNQAPSISIDTAYSTEVNTSGGSNPSSLSANTEYYVASVYNAVSNTMYLYINGAPADSASMGGGNISQLGATQAWFGAAVNYGDNNLNGSINEIRIWNGALTPAQIADHYTLGPDEIPNPVLGMAISSDSGAGTDATFSWSSSYAGLRLETTPSLGEGEEWTPVTNLPSIEDGSFVVPLTTTNNAGFYRLRY